MVFSFFSFYSKQSLDLSNTYLPRLCLDIWFATQVSPFISQEILDKKHQASLCTMVDSYHIPNTLMEKDLSAKEKKTLFIIIKCQYNTRSDWFKQRARACFMRVQSTELTNARAICRVCFENKAKCVRKIIDFLSQNK